MPQQDQPEATLPTCPTQNPSALHAFAEDLEIASEFVIECREHLALAKEELRRIDGNSFDLNSINALFRAVHTIKGLAGFMELDIIQTSAHEAETLLDYARCHRLAMIPSASNGLSKRLDAIRREIEAVQLRLDGTPSSPAVPNTAFVPIGNQFQRAARLVRGLSRQLGKQVVVVTSGGELAIAKSVAQAIASPLVHMLRNAIDHGLELPEERALAGKDPVGRIRLAAHRGPAGIVIEVSDDGRGLDRDRILAKAKERGLVQPGPQLSDTEIFQLILEAGLTTSDAVTAVSGRGVGMDVVREHMQKLGGVIDIKSEAGKGVTFYLRLP